jgi:hypothetical protein
MQFVEKGIPLAVSGDAKERQRHGGERKRD